MVFDRIYNLFLLKNLFFSSFLWEKIDQNIIDRLGPLGVSSSVYSASKYLKNFKMEKYLVMLLL